MRGPKLFVSALISPDGNTPLNNLWLSMLNRMGVSVPRFGDSTGRLAQLT